MAVRGTSAQILPMPNPARTPTPDHNILEANTANTADQRPFGTVGKSPVGHKCDRISRNKTFYTANTGQRQRALDTTFEV